MVKRVGVKAVKAVWVSRYRGGQWELTLACGHTVLRRAVYKERGGYRNYPAESEVRPAPKSVRSCEKCFRDEFYAVYKNQPLEGD